MTLTSAATPRPDLRPPTPPARCAAGGTRQTGSARQTGASPGESPLRHSHASHRGTDGIGIPAIRSPRHGKPHQPPHDERHRCVKQGFGLIVHGRIPGKGTSGPVQSSLSRRAPNRDSQRPLQNQRRIVGNGSQVGRHSHHDPVSITRTTDQSTELRLGIRRGRPPQSSSSQRTGCDGREFRKLPILQDGDHGRQTCLPRICCTPCRVSITLKALSSHNS